MTDPITSLKMPDLGDPAPKAKPRRERSDKGVPRTPRKTEKVTDTQLKKALEEMLAFPALPSMMYPTIEGKLYLVSHFASTAEWGAEQLVQASKLSPALRGMLEKVQQQTATAMLIPFILVYLGGPVLFIVGQKQMAESVTAIASMDEAMMQQLAEQFAGNMMSPEHASENGQQTQSESDIPQGPAE